MEEVYMIKCDGKPVEIKGGIDRNNFCILDVIYNSKDCKKEFVIGFPSFKDDATTETFYFNILEPDAIQKGLRVLSPIGTVVCVVDYSTNIITASSSKFDELECTLSVVV